MTPKGFDLLSETIFCFLPLQAQCSQENVPAFWVRCGVFSLLGLNKGAGQGDFLSPAVSPVLGPLHMPWTPLWMSPASFWCPNPTASL